MTASSTALPARPAAPPDRGLPAGERDMVPWFGLPAAYGLYFLRFGYDYGASDQDELLPYLLHRLDPGLFTADWFVMLQASGFNIRTYVVGVLEGLAAFLPVWLAVLLLYLAAWLTLAGAVYRIGRMLTGHRAAALGAVVAVLVLTPQWTLGGNDLAAGMFVPSLLAWAIGLWGVAGFLAGRPLRAGLLLGLAAWAQLLVGLQLAGLLGLTLLPEVGGARRPNAARRLLLFSAAFLIAAAPIVVPILSAQLAPAPPPPADAPSLFYILAAFRNPHHYLFDSFPLGARLRFGLLAGMGLAAWCWLRRRDGLAHAPFIGRALAAIALVCTGAYLLTVVAPVLFVAKLQLFKLTVFAKLLFVLVLCGALVHALPPGLRARLEALLNRTRLHALLVLAGWTLLLALALPPGAPLHGRLHPLARRATPGAHVERWAGAQTPRDAVFAVPPSVSTFRSQAQRAVVVNFKAFPFADPMMYTWFSRLTDLAPLPLPARGGGGALAALDAAYHRQSPAALTALARRYGVDYVVRTAPLQAAAGFTPVFQEGGWYVYRVEH